MQPISVKINKAPTEKNKPPKNILNLNGSSNKSLPNNKTKKYLWLLLILVFIESSGLAWLYFTKPVSPYFKIFPQNLIASSYFNQSSLLELLKNIKSENTNWPLFNWEDSALRKALNKIKIEQPDQLLGLFEDQMALALPPQRTDQKPTWLALATIKVPPDIFSQAQDKTEQTLKQNYNLISESYRQITITQVKPLNQEQRSIFYARVNSYFILTNDNALIKTTIDKIIR